MPDYTEMQTAMDRLGDKREQGKAHDTRSEAAHQPSQTQAVPPNSTDMECRRDVNVPASDVLANPVPFFDHWFAGCEGVVQLVAISPDGKPLEPYNLEPPYNWNAAAAWAREQSEAGRNVYFCPVTQRPGTTGHRSEATAFELPGVFADVDDVDPETTWPKIEATGFVNATVASS